MLDPPVSRPANLLYPPLPPFFSFCHTPLTNASSTPLVSSPSHLFSLRASPRIRNLLGIKMADDLRAPLTEFVDALEAKLGGRGPAGQAGAPGVAGEKGAPG